MKAVVQRVNSAGVTVDNHSTGSIGRGLLVFLGVHKDDTGEVVQWLVDKIISLRIFSDSDGKMNLSLRDVGGSLLVVSQFTLYGDCTKGKRPSFTDAAIPEKGNALYELFIEKARAIIPRVETGEFGAHMSVTLENDGPVTMIIEKIV